MHHSKQKWWMVGFFLGIVGSVTLPFSQAAAETTALDIQSNDSNENILGDDFNQKIVGLGTTIEVNFSLQDFNTNKQFDIYIAICKSCMESNNQNDSLWFVTQEGDFHLYQNNAQDIIAYRRNQQAWDGKVTLLTLNLPDDFEITGSYSFYAVLVEQGTNAVEVLNDTTKWVGGIAEETVFLTRIL